MARLRDLRGRGGRLVLLALLGISTTLGAMEPGEPRGAPAPAPAPTNILVILLDDVGMDKVGYAGEHPSPANTPNIDLLAANGVSYPNTWVNPVCSPTRVSILTGRYGFRTGMGHVTGGPTSASGNFTPLAEEVTLPELLAPRRYRSWAVGKWHAGTNAWPGGIGMTPIEWGGFERHVGTIANVGPDEFDQQAWYDWPMNVADQNGSEIVSSRTYATTATIDTALELIHEQPQDPFFLWLSLNAPHKPWHQPPAHLHTEGALCGGACGAKKKYNAALEAADTELGRLLTSIRPEILERTTVILLGDNGTPNFAVQAPWSASNNKGAVREGGVNVPMLAFGSEVENPGRVSEDLINGVDIFATVLALAGQRMPDDGVTRDSHSFLHTLRDTSGPARDWVYSERFRPNGLGIPRTLDERVVRNVDGWKLELERLPPAADEYRLFFLPDDAFEQQNLYPPTTAEAQAAFDELSAQLQLLQPE